MKSYQIIIPIVATLALSGCNISTSPVENEKSINKPDAVAKESLESQVTEGDKSIKKSDPIQSESNETTLLMPPELLERPVQKVVEETTASSMPPELLERPTPKVVKDTAPSIPPELLNEPVQKVVKEKMPFAPPGVTPPVESKNAEIPAPPFLDQEPAKAK